MITVHCAACSAEFQVKPSALKRPGHGRFCSRKCKNTGPFNPHWKGGVAKDNMRYKLRFRERYPEKARAHDLVTRAKKDGRLVRQPCGTCGATEDVHAHHEDYSQPLAVEWLCRPCHLAEHEKKIPSRNWTPVIPLLMRCDFFRGSVDPTLGRDRAKNAGFRGVSHPPVIR